MKRLPILILVIPFLLLACFGDDDPTDPDGNGGDVSPYSGSFSCTSNFVSSDCDFPATGPPSVIDVLIDGDLLMVEAATGVWNENVESGTATSEQICVPIPDLHPDCVRCADYTFTIEFATTDSLWGTYIVTYHYSAECGTDECYTIYSIEASR